MLHDRHALISGKQLARCSIRTSLSVMRQASLTVPITSRLLFPCRYVRHREPLVTVALVQMAWTVAKLGAVWLPKQYVLSSLPCNFAAIQIAPAHELLCRSPESLAPAAAATEGAMDAAYSSHRGSAAMLLTLIVLTNFTMGFLVPNVYLRGWLVWSAFSLLLQAMVLVRCPAAPRFLMLRCVLQGTINWQTPLASSFCSLQRTFSLLPPSCTAFLICHAAHCKPRNL